MGGAISEAKLVTKRVASHCGDANSSGKSSLYHNRRESDGVSAAQPEVDSADRRDAHCHMSRSKAVNAPRSDVKIMRADHERYLENVTHASIKASVVAKLSGIEAPSKAISEAVLESAPESTQEIMPEAPTKTPTETIPEAANRVDVPSEDHTSASRATGS